MAAYDDLISFIHDTEALSSVAGRLDWDQETMMPEGATDQRAQEAAALEAVLHARRTDARIGDWLAATDDATLDAVGQANMRHLRRRYARDTRVPADLARAMAQASPVSQRAWAAARAEEDVAAFLPHLENMLGLKRDLAAALAEGGDAYDALHEEFEPGNSGAALAAMFDALRPDLVDLRAQVMERPEPAGLTGQFEPHLQLALSEELAKVFGYDMARGRIDLAVHPFSSGAGNDVRITTRVDPADPFNCLYSTIHEVGHACYEQNINPDFAFMPIGRGDYVSMGVHESQSRIYENQLGRSRAFCGWLYGRMRDRFGDIGVDSEAAFYAAVNRVKRGYIRTEADELQYNLHILLRFDLERALISGDLQASDLEAAWNDRFAADFGYAVDRPSNGVLQDVHWSLGLFGYFPTYTLGNVYAGCLFEALQTAVPGLENDLARGDLTAATGWLRENVQQVGGLYAPADVIARASGQTPGPEPLLRYIRAKFTDLYML